jgi:hypothetical protein
LKEGQTQKVKITIQNDGKGNVEKTLTYAGSIVCASERKEIAIVSRGEIFVTNADGGSTKESPTHQSKSATCNGHQTIKR